MRGIRVTNAVRSRAGGVGLRFHKWSALDRDICRERERDDGGPTEKRVHRRRITFTTKREQPSEPVGGEYLPHR
jgi:hypothetical protein